MSIQNNRAIRPLTLLTGLLIAVLALACSAHGQAMKGMANAGAAAPVDAARPYSYVFLDPLEGQHTATNDGNHVGIEMHGHWVIDVKDPDGTLVQHRDFENTLQPNGSFILMGLLAGYAVPSNYVVFLESAGTTPCTPPGNGQGCVLVGSQTTTPGNLACQNYACFTGLTTTFSISTTNATNANTMTLAGNFTATRAGTIDTVQTVTAPCPANFASPTTATSSTPAACQASTVTYGFYTLSSASITSVPVANGQIVQVTVVISFS